MKIQDAICNECFVEIKPSGQGYDICELSGEINIKHGKFTGWSSTVPLLKLQDFINQFESFCISRNTEPKLEGVYNTYFQFYTRETINGEEIILMEFSIGDARFSPFIFNLTGLLEIDAKKLPSILSDFRELAQQSY